MKLREKKYLCIKKVIEDYCYNKGDFKIFEFINSLKNKLSRENYDNLVKNIEELVNSFSFALSTHYAIFVNFEYFSELIESSENKRTDEKIFDIVDIEL